MSRLASLVSLRLAWPLSRALKTGGNVAPEVDVADADVLVELGFVADSLALLYGLK